VGWRETVLVWICRSCEPEIVCVTPYDKNEPCVPYRCPWCGLDDVGYKKEEITEEELIKLFKKCSGEI
jgi:hypothetical protein